ncbi:hypothetical protein E5676_scaffold162G00010 [Cucumis melo var. makuwa]|uniref:Uncharacterized protein n=1 Tax=Cucumis melo var. makuwa TaxID=1194695 RepID=A0A5D3DJG5_CUCMM|nr:hypothetical protein E5676_scaffold162G00010 [Cucumis melo var. makuwa]
MPTYSHSRSPHFRSSFLSHATSRLPTVSTFNRAFFFDPIAASANFLLLRTPPDVAQKNYFEQLTFTAVRSSFSRRRVKQRRLVVRVGEVTLEFRNFTASAVEANSPLLSFIYGVAYLIGTVSFGITRLICASFGITTLICASFGITRLICKSMARGRPARDKKDA